MGISCGSFVSVLVRGINRLIPFLGSWDFRKGQRGCLDKVAVAHTASVTTVDWRSGSAVQNQPTNEIIGNGLGWIASGGLDRIVKVRPAFLTLNGIQRKLISINAQIWDLTAPGSSPRLASRPTYVLHPSYPVRRILFRPSYECEIALVSNTEFASKATNHELGTSASLGGPGSAGATTTGFATPMGGLSRVGSSYNLEALNLGRLTTLGGFSGFMTPLPGSGGGGLSRQALDGLTMTSRLPSDRAANASSGSGASSGGGSVLFGTTGGTSAAAATATDQQGGGDLGGTGGGDAVEIWDVRRGWIAKWAISGSSVEGGITGMRFFLRLHVHVDAYIFRCRYRVWRLPCTLGSAIVWDILADGFERCDQAFGRNTKERHFVGCDWVPGVRD